MEITFKQIGTIHTPFTDLKGMPIQPTGAINITGTVKIWKEYKDGLKDLDGFSHIFLIYQFHQAKKTSLVVKPFLDDKQHGIFATRGPTRPNAIGLSIVELLDISGCTLRVSGVDIVDDTPLLDIKPYVPRFDARENVRVGWLDLKDHRVNNFKSDGSFTD
ncbi:MAG: tRNA (N6-threonylcarbamoyladenosine(37)-N6)-methyltransferase TrmO [Candidatus Hodarchaeales archaeon]